MKNQNYDQNNHQNYDQLETILYEYLDKVRYVISSDLWRSELLNCSKNDLFVLLLLYRREEVNMTQIAEYLKVPLNTATGIVSRMQKKGLLHRERNEEDKRIVTIQLTKEGKQQIQAITGELLRYGNLLLEKCSAEEMKVLFELIDKVMLVLEEEKQRQVHKENVTKKVVRITIE